MSKYRKDFPIFKNSQLIYLDSAATSQKPKIVLDAIQEYYKTYNANVRRSLYPIAEKATEKVEQVRKQVARFINAKNPSEIVFVRNTTEAINLVMNTWGFENIDDKSSIVVSIMEHHSNFVPWQFLAQISFAPFEVIQIKEDGNLDIEDMLIKVKHAKLLAITHVSNVLGTINPIKKIIQKSRKINPQLKILIDGAQAVPHMQINVQDLDADFYCFSGHKMMASTGIGVLYGKENLLKEMSPFLFGGEMIQEVTQENTTFADIPYKFEAGTPDIAGIVSLGAAIEYLDSIGMKNIQRHEQELIAYCLSRMGKINGLKIYGPKKFKDRSGVISFTLDKIHPHDIAQILGDKNICLRGGHHCAQPLHTRLNIPATARVSFYIYNNKEDVDIFIKGIQEVVSLFRRPQ